MAASAKFTMTSTILSLLFLVIYFYPMNKNFQLTSSSRLVQHEASLDINKYDIKLARIEEQLAKARGEIRKVIVEKSFTSSQNNESFIPEGTIYKNRFAFLQSHIEMMNTFKIWTYKEGDMPLVHDGPLKNIYAVEGHFIGEMEREGNPMAANHPDEAHAFFIPISVTRIVQYLYTPTEAIDFLDRVRAIVEDYIEIVAQRYPYWNRSNGADHFFVSCHDWAPFVSLQKPKQFKNLIRVLCNANSSEGFIPSRDVSMTEIYGPYNNIPIVSSGQSPYNRSILAFFAGGNHGLVRKSLFQHWGNQTDIDIQVYSYLPKDKNYTKLLGQSKFCLCPSGYEVASARATEAIYVGCIPVMIKDHYVLPYSDVLDWSKFSIQVPVDNIPDLKRILQEIPFSKYLEMQKKVMKVQRHLMINIPAKHFDVFHMILHSVWLRRLNVRLLS